MRPSLALRFAGTAVAALAAAFANAQDTLTLDEALRLARERNGIIRAAYQNVNAAGARVTQSLAAFYPTVTPAYQYNSNRREFAAGSFSQEEGATGGVNANWRLLDVGQRQFSLLASRRSEEAERSDALQTLRQTLFTVHQQYYDALRAQELSRIAEAQVERTKTILDATIARAGVGDVAEKDILQARADHLNAQVEALDARRQVANAEASLKATIGFDTTQELPDLQVSAEPDPAPALPTLDELVAEGLAQRSDLRAQRRRVDAQQFVARRLDREAGLTAAIDANFDQQLIPDSLESRTLSLVLEYPLFDAGRARAAAREARYGLEAQRANLIQSEREARADIESAYYDFTQNSRRLEASRLALEAARVNFDAAQKSFQLGASDIIAVATAQVTLVTAESNFVEATYDYYIADVRLDLVTGRPVPGERAN